MYRPIVAIENRFLIGLERDFCFFHHVESLTARTIEVPRVAVRLSRLFCLLFGDSFLNRCSTVSARFTGLLVAYLFLCR
jgi:hypothetical protein